MIRRTAFVLVTLLVVSVFCAAQTPPQNPPATQTPAAAAPATPVVIGPAKMAFVDIQLAIQASDEGKKEAAVLQGYVDQKSAELQKRQKELEALRTQLEVTGSKLNDDARADLVEQIEARNTDLERFQQDTQSDIDKRRNRLQNTIANKMLKAIEKVAKEKGVSVVQFIGVANIYGYIETSLVITEDVVKAYNVMYPAAAPAAAPVKK